MLRLKPAAFASAILAVTCAEASAQKIEPKAEEILKRMSNFLASQQRFQFEAQSQIDAVLKSGQKIEFDSESTVSLERPNKLRSDRKGEVAKDLSFYYDGKSITLFGRGKGLYATTPAPEKLDQAIDFARDKLDLDAPGADLLLSAPYPALIKDVISAVYIGQTLIDGTPVHHLAFRGKETDWQIWIEDGEKPLPRKYVITSKNIKGQPDFEVSLRNWNLSPGFSGDTFKFVPPPNAQRIEFVGALEAKPKKKG